ncbi:MAG: hypothetical protein HQL13_04370 [Candidatus Omnitrophica bacterium]|nr:hypothetical protein [Candidatus Omnitrophota bacterium]
MSRMSPQDVQLVMGIGIDIKTRARVFQFFKERGYCFLSYVHPSAIVSSTAEILEGCIIFPGVILGSGVKLEENVCVYSASVIEHQTRIGAHSYVSPACATGGNCHISRECFLGINSTLIEGIELGKGIVVGAGAVVLQSFLEEKVVVAGVPAKIIRRLDGKLS